MKSVIVFFAPPDISSSSVQMWYILCGYLVSRVVLIRWFSFQDRCLSSREGTGDEQERTWGWVRFFVAEFIRTNICN